MKHPEVISQALPLQLSEPDPAISFFISDLPSAWPKSKKLNVFFFIIFTLYFCYELTCILPRLGTGNNFVNPLCSLLSDQVFWHCLHVAIRQFSFLSLAEKDDLADQALMLSCLPFYNARHPIVIDKISGETCNS